ncbi:MAG: hypothetical protein KA967_00990 [Methanoculleus sp.]|nr:hypothetical protein [Methanoculleus sp.]
MGFDNPEYSETPEPCKELFRPDELGRTIEAPYHVETFPDGREVLVIGDPERDGQDIHIQGDNTYGFEGDCGLCSCQGILNLLGIHLSEDDIVRYAVDHGLCHIDLDPRQSGGTTLEQQTELLNDLGVPAHWEVGLSMEQLAEYVEQGHYMIAEVNAGVLFDEVQGIGDDPEQSNHAIVITGVARDLQTGSIVGFYVNDTGGFCRNSDGSARGGALVDAAHMKSGWADTGGLCVIAEPRRSG